MDHRDDNNPISAFEAPEPPAGLTEKVLLRIAVRQRRILGVKIAATAAVFGTSVFAMVAGYADTAASMDHSGFLQIGGLIFSDFSAIAANFPDFALSLVEAFPVFTAALLLGGAMVAVWSMAALINEASLLHATHEQSFGI
jgi:hypothetical protein